MSTLLGAAIGTGHLALGLIAIAAFWLFNDERGNLVIFFERGSAWQPGFPPRLFRDGEASHQRFHAYRLGRVGWIPGSASLAQTSWELSHAMYAIHACSDANTLGARYEAEA